MEVWKPVAINPKYEVSDLGRVRLVRTGCVLKPFTDRLQEYDRVMLYMENGKRKKVMVHILVAEAFLGPKPNGYEIDHINSIRKDNRAANLKYVTREENRNNPYTKFNYEVSRIRKMIVSGKKKVEDIDRLVRVMKAL